MRFPNLGWVGILDRNVLSVDIQFSGVPDQGLGVRITSG